ncbi:ODAD1 central coiled coil region domain-containing protein [Plasmodiophora brassicae]
MVVNRVSLLPPGAARASTADPKSHASAMVNRHHIQEGVPTSSTARAETFLDEANDQLEALHRAVFDLAHVNRAHSAAPIKSVMRRRLHSRVLSEMENASSLSRYDVEVTQRHVQVLTGRPREQRSVHLRLRDQDGIAAYADRQGRAILAEINDEIAAVREQIEQRRPFVDSDPAMPTSSATKRRWAMRAFLDDRLDMTQRAANELRTGNRALREQIDDLNLERRADQRMMARMQDQIVEKQDEIRALLDGIRAAETTTSASLNALVPMQAGNDAEYAAFVRDWHTTAELDDRHRAIEQEIVRMQGEMYFGMPDDDNQVMDPVDQIMSRTAWRIAKDKAELFAAQQRQQELVALARSLMKISGQDDLDAVVLRFQTSDEEQIRKFNEVHRLSLERAAYERELFEIRSQSESLEYQPPPRSSAVVVPCRRTTRQAIDWTNGQVQAVQGECDALECDIARLRHVFEEMTASLNDALSCGTGHDCQMARVTLSSSGFSISNCDLIVSTLEQHVMRILAATYGPERIQDVAAPWLDPDVDVDGPAIDPPTCPDNDDDVSADSCRTLLKPPS